MLRPLADIAPGGRHPETGLVYEKMWQQFDKDKQELICKPDRLAFPIRDDIPVMLEDEARHLSFEEIEALSK